MNTSRMLTLANLFGCLAITGIILAQWVKERGMEVETNRLKHELAAARSEQEELKKLTISLEGDVSQLKESIESMARTRKETEETLAKLTAGRDARDAADAARADGNREQVKIWEDAIAARDARIRQLDATLAATRERLDQAILKLKEAGAR